MADAYRERVPRCPTCNVDLQLRRLGEEEIDVCPGCGAVWLDWFDGQPGELIAGHLRDAPHPEGAPAVFGSANGGSANRPLCPICQGTLREERFLGSDAVVERCAACAGMLVRPASFAALLGFDATRPAEPEATEPRGPSLWERLVSLMRRLTAQPWENLPPD